MEKQHVIHSDEQPVAQNKALEKEIRAGEKAEGEKPVALSLNVVTQPTEFLLLRTEWNELVTTSQATVFQTFDWQWFWWKHYGKELQLYIITLRHTQKLVGIAPFFLQTTKVFGIPLRHIMRMIGCGIASKENYGLPAEYGPSDYLDVIVRPGYEVNVAKSFLDFLRRQSTKCNEARFENVPHEGTFFQYFLPVLSAEGLKVSTTRNEFAPYISIPASPDDFLQRLSPGMRHHIRQSVSQFKHHPPFSIAAVTSQAVLHNLLLDLAYLHQVRWNSLGYAGLFSDQRFLDFQKDVAQKFYEHGVLWFKVVRMGGIQTAARMGFNFKGKMYDYLSGFDESFPEGRKRPSLALLMEMIEDAIIFKCSAIDLLRGTEQYKMKLTSSTAQNSDIRLTGFNDGSSFVYALYTVVKIAGKLIRKFMDEKKLFSIHVKVNGFPKCFFTYPRFVLSRVEKKMTS